MCALLPVIDDLLVERLARADAVPETLEGPLLEVLLHHGAVEGGRGAHHGHGELLQRVEHRRAREPRHAVDEDGAALRPRPEQRGPGGLGPARVGDAPHDVVLREVQPVLAHHVVADPVGAVGVPHHLGLARGAAGEVDLQQQYQHTTVPTKHQSFHLHHVILVRVDGLVAGAGPVVEAVPADPAHLAPAHDDLRLEVEARLVERVHLGRGLGVGDDAVRAGGEQPALDVAALELRGARQQRHVTPDRAHVDDPPLGHLTQVNIKSK